jgi:hypothetical protein
MHYKTGENLALIIGRTIHEKQMQNKFSSQISGNIRHKHHKKAQKNANINLKIVTF